MDIIMSTHALEKARERGVTINEVKKIIQQGAKYLQGNKIVSEFTSLRVVYKKIKNKLFVITVMVKK